MMYDAGYVENERKIEDPVAFGRKVKLFFDTTALMSDGFRSFLDRYGDRIKEEKLRLCTIEPVIVHLTNKSRRGNPAAVKRAEETLELIEELKRQGIFTIKSRSRYPFLGYGLSMQQLILLALYKMSKKSIAIVSCNQNLSDDIMMMNRLRSVKGNYIYSINLSDDGFLYNNDTTFRETEEADDEDDLFSKLAV